MLVLTRKTDETILITASNGEVIEVKVVELQGTKVRLGVTAPGSVSIHRSEIAARIAAKAGVDSPVVT